MNINLKNFNGIIDKNIKDSDSANFINFDDSKNLQFKEQQKIDLNNFNSRKAEEKIITEEMVNYMKEYFNTFFSASPSVIKEIFTVKNNTIQHPIYAFKGGCFICSETSITHLKDERGDIFLENKKIKLIKSANIFKLLDDSAYMDLEKNYIDNKDFYENDEELFYQEDLDNNENVDSQDYCNEDFTSTSCYSDSDFEFSKDNFRKDIVNSEEIINDLNAFLAALSTNIINSDNNPIVNKLNNGTNRRSSTKLGYYKKTNSAAIETNEEKISEMKQNLNKKEFSFVQHFINSNNQQNHLNEIEMEKCITLENEKYNKNFNNLILMSEKEKKDVIKEENSLQSEKSIQIPPIIEINDINLQPKNNSQNNLVVKIPKKQRYSNDDYLSILTPNRFQNLRRISNYPYSINENLIGGSNTHLKRPITKLSSLTSKKFLFQTYNNKKAISPDRITRSNSRFFRMKMNSDYEKNKKKLSNDVNLNINNEGTDQTKFEKSTEKLKSNKTLKKPTEKKKIYKLYPTDPKSKNNDKKNNLNYNNNFCDICLSSILTEVQTEDIIRLECGHFYCKECIKIYIINTISKWNIKNNIDHSKCPKPVCGKSISTEEIEFILKDDEINTNKFSKFLNRIKMLGKINSILVCPIPDCDSYAKRKNIDKNFATCLKKHNFCIKCNRDHLNKKCLPLSDAELETEIYLKKAFDIKKCPQCLTLLHKFSDCNTNAVKCGYELCNYEYCWLCLDKSEKTHYTNPLSSCYKLEKIDTKHVLATYNCLRMTKYFIIVLMLMMVIPFIIIFSTFLFVTFFILAFVPDGSAVKHIKMKRKGLEPIFKLFVTGIYVAMAFPLVPLGYILQASFIILSPLILAYKKFSTYRALHF